jgi:hypothetical protein
MKPYLAAAAAIAGALALAPAAAPTPPQTASGAGSATPPVVTSVQQADGNTIIEFTDTGTVTGTFTGTFVQTGRMVVHADGRAETNSTVVFTGTGPCGSGTIPSRFVGTTVGGVGAGHADSIDFADNTANTHTNIDFVIAGGTFTYSGTYHCG